MRRKWAWVGVAWMSCWGVGCGATVLAVTHADLDGNSEYWVCEGGEAKSCRGERPEDIDPPGFQQRVNVVAPPAACVNGVATLEIVVDGDTVQRVRYQCALPKVPTGLPPSVPPGTASAASATSATSADVPMGSGLPPSAPAAPSDSSAPSASSAPTAASATSTPSDGVVPPGGP